MKTFYKWGMFIVLALSLSLGTGPVYGAGFPGEAHHPGDRLRPGSGTDILARFVAATIGKYKFLPQPIVVESKEGGSGAVAMAYVAGKKKDPYYLMLASPTAMLLEIQGNTSVSYKDFTPICNIDFDEHMLLTGANSKFKSVKEIVDYAKANPEQVTVGGPNAISPVAVTVYRFEKAAGIKLRYVPFGGGGQALVGLMGGHVDVAMGNPGEVMEMVKANKIKILGVITEKRLPFAGLRDYPTLKEQGYNAVGLGMYRGIFSTGDIPADARKVLEEAFLKFSKTDEYKKFHDDNMIGDGWLDGAAFGKYLDEKNEGYRTALREMGVITKK